MGVVSLTYVQRRVIGLLLASRANVYASTVDGEIATYPVTQEITDAILEADEMVCREIINTPGHPYRNAFMTASANFSTGDLISPHLGDHGKVDIDDGTGSFKGGTLADSRAEVLEVSQHPNLYPDAKRWYWIEDSEITHTGAHARVYYPVFTLGSTCQAHEGYTEAVVQGGVSLLPKSGESLDLFDRAALKFGECRTLIRAKVLIIPETSQVERAA